LDPKLKCQEFKKRYRENKRGLEIIFDELKMRVSTDLFFFSSLAKSKTWTEVFFKKLEMCLAPSPENSPPGRKGFRHVSGNFCKNFCKE
jgi:hypothetical protein